LAMNHTGHHEVVGFWGGFHGKTARTLSANGAGNARSYGPVPPGHVLPFANCYRCPLKLKYPSCGIACADLARDQLRHQSTGSVAAVIIEPMQGTAGNVIPPPEFMVRAQASIRTLHEENVLQNVREVGNALLDELRTWPDRLRWVGDVRGEGLFLGVELVADRQTKEPLAKKICDQIFQDGLRRGLLAMSYTHAIRLQPALTIDRDTALSGLSLLREAIEAVARRQGAA